MEYVPTRRGYVICGEARSGSSFLVRVLISTGELGFPFEYFSRGGCRREMLADPERGLRDLLRHAASPNGIYGIKLFSRQLEITGTAGWLGRLPHLQFVHLERRDLLGQAISLLRANQTGQFVSMEPARAEPRYDRRAIAGLLGDIAADQARWRAYFARNGIEPLQLFYEDVVADPQAAASAVAERVGLGHAPAIDLGRVAPTVQRDDLSLAWRERFLDEAGDLDRMATAWPASWRSTLRRIHAQWTATIRRDRRSWSEGNPEPLNAPIRPTFLPSGS